MVPTEYYLILSAVLFSTGALGVVFRRNVLIIFMCVEMMLNAVNLTFAALGRMLFTDYLLPFELTSVLLLVGMIGAVVLARPPE